MAYLVKIVNFSFWEKFLVIVLSKIVCFWSVFKFSWFWHLLDHWHFLAFFLL
ncbi:hypothetical protein ACE6H2_021037 [Prunus campanulata]